MVAMEHLADWCRPVIRLVLAGAVVGLGAAALPTPAFAATVVVCPTTCPYSDIQLALNHASVGDTIVVGPGTYRPGGTVDIAKNVIVAGRDTLTGTAADVTIDGSGNGNESVMRVEIGVTATVAGITITGGHPADGASGANGIAGAAAGGIENRGTRTARNIVVTGNTTGAGGNATGGPPALAGSGGVGAGILNGGTLNLVRSVVSGNTTGAGGSSFLGSTFAGFGGDGGGIYNAGTLTITLSTISGNAAGQGGTDGTSVGSAGVGGGISTTSGVTLSLVNTLIAGNLDPTSEDDLAGTYRDPATGKSGLTASDTYNLLGLTVNGQTYTLLFILSSAGLANNGGPTQTIALRSGGPAGNPAIGTANKTVCQGLVIKGIDQRGAVRPTTTCDLGAFEAPPAVLAP